MSWCKRRSIQQRPILLQTHPSIASKSPIGDIHCQPPSHFLFPDDRNSFKTCAVKRRESTLPLASPANPFNQSRKTILIDMAEPEAIRTNPSIIMNGLISIWLEEVGVRCGKLEQWPWEGKGERNVSSFLILLISCDFAGKE